jgi:hypothetical protein
MHKSGSRPVAWCTGMKLLGGVALVLSGGGRSVVGVPGQGLWENAVGQAVRRLMGCEPVGVFGRPCDLPGCAVSANP